MSDISLLEILELLRRVSAQDQRAVEKIYRHYYGALFVFIRLRVSDDGAVQELANDTFLVAFKQPERFRGESSFKTWLFGIAKNLTNNWLRAQKTQPLASSVSDDSFLDAVADDSWSVFDQIDSKQVRQIVHKCLRLLPPTQSEALYWVFFEEESLQSVSQRLGCPEGTIKSRLFHGKLKVADCVKRRLLGMGVSQ